MFIVVDLYGKAYIYMY